jgi:hypothetical protein
MKTLEKIVVGSIVGAIFNALLWYCWTVLFVLISTSKLVSGGEWGGNFAVAFIGGIIGLLTGAIVGLLQPTKTKAVLVSVIIALICLVPVLKSFLSNDYAQSYLQEGNYGQVWLEGFGFAGFFIICVLIVWVVAKIVLSFPKKY